MIKWQRVLHDIEAYPNYFCTTVECFDTGKKLYFEISDRINHLARICLFYRSFERRRTRLISFNGIHFDSPVINYILLHQAELSQLSSANAALKIQEFVEYIIDTEFWWKKDEMKPYKYNQKWIDIDVFLYWSKMLRQSKRISLKSLGIQLGYPVVQELPYPPGSYLTHSQMDEVGHYNYIHDLGILKLIVVSNIMWQGKPTTFQNMIELRAIIWRTYGLNAMSWDAPKIASELMLDFYCKQTGENKWEVGKQRHNEGRPLSLHDPEFKLPIFQELYKEFEKAGRDYSKEVVFIHNKTKLKISYGIGGIHSVNNNEIYESDDKQLIVTSDIGSLYPSLIINYKLIKNKIVLERYIAVKVERMIAKKIGDKGKDATYKLILNSLSGLLDSPYSWLYYPEGAMKMRLMGQLIMTKTMEELAIADFQVVSCNTDGVEVIVPKEREKEYYTIVDNVGKFFNLDFEHDIYSKIVYKNINNYIAVNLKKEVKVKGSDFITKPNFGDSCNALIIPKAIGAYFTKGIKPEVFVRDRENHIYDFCLSKKVDKSYKVIHGDEVLPQRLNRFYVSKKGKFLYKNKNNKSTHMLKGWGTIIYNNHVEQSLSDYPIDYSFYLSQINQIINEIEIPNKIQLELFQQ